MLVIGGGRCFNYLESMCSVTRLGALTHTKGAEKAFKDKTLGIISKETVNELAQEL